MAVFNSSLKLKTASNSTIKWLKDLRMMSENECLCVLQAKSLVGKLSRIKTAQCLKVTSAENDQNNKIQQQQQQQHQQQQQSCINQNATSALENTKNQFMPIAKENTNIHSSKTYSVEKVNILDDMDMLINRSKSINQELDDLLRLYDTQSLTSIYQSFGQVFTQIQAITRFFNKTVSYCYRKHIRASPNLNNIIESIFLVKKIENKIGQIVKQLEKSKLNHCAPQCDNAHQAKKEFLVGLKSLNENFLSFQHEALRLCVQVQLSNFSNSKLNSGARTTIEKILNQILDISMQNELVKKIFVEFNGIIVFIGLLKEPLYRTFVDSLLRILSILTGCLESFKFLKSIDYFGIMADILCDENAAELTRSEAANCVAQISSPSLEYCQKLPGFFENIPDLIRALTILCRDSSDVEIFFIGAAALANLTFYDNSVCQYLNQFSTAQVLIENYYLKNYNSIFVKDQIITIIANMALFDEFRTEIIEFNGLNLIVEFLNESPFNFYCAENAEKNNYNQNQAANESSELAACERVQQKAAIAISRFSKERQYSLLLVELGVIPRLVNLCRNCNERNNSDSVLLACLASLRQISVTCEDAIEENIMDLVQPKLKDSFFNCSSTESYV